jgi:hypothetical protein
MQKPDQTRRGWVPVVALLVLAPWAAECSWGGFAVGDYPLVILFLGPLYGGAAVLVREVARRTGRGWPTMVLLAAAFGVVQAALVDQSLFNQGFLDDTELAELARTTTVVPVFGFSAEHAVTFVGNHVLLSICAPIMLVESMLRPPDRHGPWLRRRGLFGIGVLYVLGSLLIFADDEDGRKGFLLAPVQAALAIAVIAGLIGAALLPRHAPRTGAGRVPHPLLFGLLVLAAQVGLWFVTGWAAVVAWVLVTAAAVALVRQWSRRPGWTQRHVVAGWSASLLTAAAGAGLSPAYKPASTTEALVSDVTVIALALVLTATAYRRARPQPCSVGR